jgi:hypothetical protein
MAKETAEQDLRAAIGSSLLDYASEVGKRRRRRQKMEVFELEAAVEIEAPVPRGSMLAVIGSDQSPELTELRAATQARDHEALDRALALLGRPSQEAPSVGALAAVPVLSELDYRGKTIAMGLGVIGLTDVATASFAFAGGGFDPAGFSATHLATPEGQSLSESLRSVLIVRQPELSPVEQALLDRLPDEDLNATVAPPYATTVFVVAVTLTSGAFPFQDPALTEAIRTRLPTLEWPPRRPSETDPKAGEERIRAWLEAPENVRDLEALDARAAVEALVQLRQDILTSSS